MKIGQTEEIYIKRTWEENNLYELVTFCWSVFLWNSQTLYWNSQAAKSIIVQYKLNLLWLLDKNRRFLRNIQTVRRKLLLTNAILIWFFAITANFLRYRFQASCNAFTLKTAKLIFGKNRYLMLESPYANKKY